MNTSRRKNKQFIMLIIVAALLLTLSSCGSKQNDSAELSNSANYTIEPFALLSQDFTDRKIVDQESALAAIGDVAEILGISDVTREFGDYRKDFVFGNTYYRFYQEYEGIPVYGRSMVVVADSYGNSLQVTGNYLNPNDIDTTPQISENEAAKLVETEYGAEVDIISEGLTIYSLSDSLSELVWQIYVRDAFMEEYWFVSALSGKVVSVAPLTYTETVSCSGKDLDDISREFPTERIEGKYYLDDISRNISIYNAHNSTLNIEWVITDSNGKIYRPDGSNKFIDEEGKRVSISGEDAFSMTIYDENGNVVGSNGEFALIMKTNNIFTKLTACESNRQEWDNPKAVSLMTRIESVYDFFQEVLKIHSYDNAYGTIFAIYNDFMGGDTENAYSSCKGIPITVLSFGVDNSLSMDVIAHEFAHSVENAVSGMNYNGESGALKEGCSDIFGEILEDWYDDGELNGSCDWIHNNLRSLASPMTGTSQKYPDSYKGTYWKDTTNTKKGNDYGGIHTNLTVISHAAYLMWNGIDGSGYFEPLTTEQLARLFYATFYSLPSDCTFSQFRSLMQNTADIMYKQGQLSYKQCRTVSNAFFQVGILPASTPVASNISLDVYGIDEELYHDYTVYVRHENQEQSFSSAEIAANGLTFPAMGEYEIMIVDNLNEDNQEYIAVRVIEHGGTTRLPVFTTYGIVKLDEPIENGAENESPNNQADFIPVELNESDSQAITDLLLWISDLEYDASASDAVFKATSFILDPAKTFYNKFYSDGMTYYSGAGPSTDPFSLFTNTDFNFYSYQTFEADQVDWILQNIFNCTPNHEKSPVDYNQQIYYYNGYYYVQWGDAGSELPDLDIISVSCNGELYHVEFCYRDSIYLYPEYMYPELQYAYAILQPKELNGKKTWTVYCVSQSAFFESSNGTDDNNHGSIYSIEELEEILNDYFQSYQWNDDDILSGSVFDGFWQNDTTAVFDIRVNTKSIEWTHQANVLVGTVSIDSCSLSGYIEWNGGEITPINLL